MPLPARAWTDGRTDGRTGLDRPDGQTDGRARRMDRHTDKLDRRTNRHTDEQNGWTEQSDCRRDRVDWLNGRTNDGHLQLQN